MIGEFLSEPKEVHSFFNGYYVGLTGIPSKDDWGEPHYWKLGWIIGRACNILTIIAIMDYGGML